MDTDLKKLRDVLIALGPLTDAEGYTFTCTPPAVEKKKYMCGWLGDAYTGLCDEPTYESAVKALKPKPDGHPGCVVVSGVGVLYPPDRKVTWSSAPAGVKVTLPPTATREDVIRETVRAGKKKYSYWHWTGGPFGARTFPITPDDDSQPTIDCSPEDFARAAASL